MGWWLLAVISNTSGSLSVPSKVTYLTLQCQRLVICQPCSKGKAEFCKLTQQTFPVCAIDMNYSLLLTDATVGSGNHQITSLSNNVVGGKQNELSVGQPLKLTGKLHWHYGPCRAKARYSDVLHDQCWEQAIFSFILVYSCPISASFYSFIRLGPIHADDKPHDFVAS